MKACNNCEHYVHDRQSGFYLCTQNENGNGYIRDEEHHICKKYKGKWGEWKMYKSPISIDYTDEIVDKIQTEQELKILARVNAEVKVDRDELLKALEYDRDQYNKGYQDGRESVLSELEALLQDQREKE